MRKLILSIAVIMGVSIASFAQINPHAIGIRGGTGNGGNGGEISYQHGFGSKNRLEIDLGWRHHNKDNYSHMAISGIYHWVWNIEGGLNWYAGVGGQLGSYRNNGNNNNDGLSLALGGQIGIEYDFNDMGAPILLSLDARPMWNFIGDYSGGHYGAALGIRYTF